MGVFTLPDRASHRETGAHTHLSESTVENIRFKTFKTLRLSNRVELVRSIIFQQETNLR
jgi:DNA-binding NarL/FixJ family response regulator